MTLKSQKPWRIFLLPIFPLLFSATFAQPQSYPQNQVDRPLTLPMGVVEIGAGAAMTRWDKTTDGGLGHESGYEPVHPSLSLRYGVDSRLELYLAGLKYRITGDHDIVETAVRAGVAGAGNSSIDGLMMDMDFGLEAKIRIIPHGYATLLAVDERYGYYSNTADTSDIGVTFGQMVSFTDWLAVEARITYHSLSGFNKKEVWTGGGAIYLNLRPSFDVLFKFNQLARGLNRNGAGQTPDEGDTRMEYVLMGVYRF